MTEVNIMIGGAGFLGKHLIESYIQKYSSKVYIVIDIPEQINKLKENKTFNNNINRVNGNIIEYVCIDLIAQNLQNLLKDIMIKYNNQEYIYNIYHLASPVGVSNHKEETFHDAMIINHNVFAFADNLRHRKGSCGSFYYTSTSEVYGNISFDKNGLPIFKVNLHIFMDKPLQTSKDYIFNNEGFRSDYIYQKLLGEKLFDGISDIFKVKILRLFNVVGKYQDPTKGVFNKFIDMIVNNETVNITSGIRSYTSIEKCIDYLDNLYAIQGSKAYMIHNICNKTLRNSVTNKELYLYLFAYISGKYSSFKLTTLNYNEVKNGNEIIYRGNPDTLSYTNFIIEFGEIIDEYINYKYPTMCGSGDD